MPGSPPDRSPQIVLPQIVLPQVALLQWLHLTFLVHSYGHVFELWLLFPEISNRFCDKAIYML